jgi:hypothetical protein
MSDRLFVGTHKGLFTIDRAADGWRIHKVDFLGEPVDVVHYDARTNRVWATLGLGHFGVKLRRSEDGGDTWEELDAPAYPEKPADVVEIDMWGRPWEWKLDKIWAFAGNHPQQPDTIWAGTLPGGLFRSDDGGTTWSMNRPLWDEPRRAQWNGGGADKPGIHSICIRPDDPDHVSVAVSSGGVWVTENGGQSWDVRAYGMRAAYMPPEQAYEPNAQDPHQMVQCAANPDVLWVQHHNGIFRSVDRACHWTEIEQAGPSTFGFAVAVHPDDADTAWFIPAIKDELRVPVDGKLVVTRTRDGGQSFDVLSKGLPCDRAYDLVYRHGFDVDGAGQRLAFGSTTGGLWTSEDQGDTWAMLPDRLPPVNVVRFAK